MQLQISELGRKILRDLCTDSRVSITELSKRHGVSRLVISQRVAALTKELGLKFTLEINYDALGFNRLHIIYFNLTKKPKPSELAKIFENDKVAQLVVTTKGEFDLVVFAMAKDSKEYFKWEIGLLVALAKYGVRMQPSEVTISHLGFIPINDSLILDSKIDDIYKKMLVALNRNSRISIRELAKEIGAHEDLARYYLKKLEKENIIRRFTTIVTKSPMKYNIVYFANYTVKEGVEKRIRRERETMYWKKLDEFPVVSEFQLMCSMTGSDISFTWACYDKEREGFAQSVETHARLYKEDAPVIKSAIVETVVRGEIPIRNIDMKDNYDRAGPGMD